MSTCDDRTEIIRQEDEAPARIKSVSSAGESMTVDTDAQKADERAAANDSLRNIARRRVRPYFVGTRIGRIAGW